MINKHPIIMIIIGVAGISLSAIFVRYSTAPSAVTAAFRLCWTVLLLSPVVWGRKEDREELLGIKKKELLLSIFSGIFLAFHFILWFESLQHTSVASSTTIVCTEVIWVALGYWLFLKGGLSKKEIIAIAIAFLGSAVIALSDQSSGQGQIYGDLLSLIAAVAVAVYTLLGRIVRKTVSTNVYTYVVYVSCAIVLLSVCIVQGHHLFEYGNSAIIVGLLLSIFSTILGHSIFSWCLKYFSPAFVSASKLCEPVVAAMLAAVLFGEMPKVMQILGGIMIIAGVYYYSRIESKEEV